MEAHPGFLDGCMKNTPRPQRTGRYLLPGGGFLNKFRDIFQPAFQSNAQLVQGFGFHIVVGFQSSDGLAVNTAFFPEPVSAFSLLLHCFPKFIIDDHDFIPPS